MRRAATVAVLLALVLAPARADTVVLRDGRRIEARCEEGPDEVVCHFPWGRTVFRRRDVERVEYDAASQQRRAEQERQDTQAREAQAAGQLESARQLVKEKNYRMARTVLERLLRQHEGSPLVAEARALLAQMQEVQYRAQGLALVGSRWLNEYQQRLAEGKIRYLGKWHEAAQFEPWLASQGYYEQAQDSKHFAMWTNVPSRLDGFLKRYVMLTEEVYREYEDILSVQDLFRPGTLVAMGQQPTVDLQGKKKAQHPEMLIRLARDQATYNGPRGTGGLTRVLREKFYLVDLYLPMPEEEDSVMPTLIHELGHVFMMVEFSDAPLFVHEGLSEYYALTHFAPKWKYGDYLFRDDMHVATIFTALAVGGYRSVSDLENLVEYNQGFGFNEYSQSWIFCNVLMKDHRNDFQRWIQALREGKEIREGVYIRPPLFDYIPKHVNLEEKRIKELQRVAEKTWKKTIADYPIDVSASPNTRLGIELLYRVPLQDTLAAMRLFALLLAYRPLVNFESEAYYGYDDAARESALREIFKDRPEAPPFDVVDLKDGTQERGRVVTNRPEDDFVELAVDGGQRLRLPRARIADIRFGAAPGRILYNFKDRSLPNLGVLAAAEAQRRLAQFYEQTGRRDEARLQYEAMERVFDEIDVLEAVKYARERLQLLGEGK